MKPCYIISHLAADVSTGEYVALTVISVSFALRGQGFFVAFVQRQNVIVGVM